MLDGLSTDVDAAGMRKKLCFGTNLVCVLVAQKRSCSVLVLNKCYGVMSRFTRVLWCYVTVHMSVMVLWCYVTVHLSVMILCYFNRCLYYIFSASMSLTEGAVCVRCRQGFDKEEEMVNTGGELWHKQCFV